MGKTTTWRNKSTIGIEHQKEKEGNQASITILPQKLSFFLELHYSKALRYADFGPKAISVAQKTVYLEVI